MNDRIADNMFQQLILNGENYDVIVTTNLNGDYLSDAAAALIGGLGFAPGANFGDDIAIFEAVHGTAPEYADLNIANPVSLILSGTLMLSYLGWEEASKRIKTAIEMTIKQKIVTRDLSRKMVGSIEVGTREFSDFIIKNYL